MMQVIRGSLSEVREILNAMPDTGLRAHTVIYDPTDAPQNQCSSVVKLDADRITDWDTFHAVFAEAFGFPNFYGHNMNAWIDCMSSLDYPDDGLTTVHAPVGGVLVLQIEDIDSFAECCPEQYKVLIECAAFVNWRRIEHGETAVLALSFAKNP